mmetsp:Transcript_6656/g.24907  ORF Transcript_6656/g.24907 Transcript_6656/m.24907 type:complete len:225 (-) Transcript_6656:442-1116(-)
MAPIVPSQSASPFWVTIHQSVQPMAHALQRTSVFAPRDTLDNNVSLHCAMEFPRMRPVSCVKVMVIAVVRIIVCARQDMLDSFAILAFALTSPQTRLESCAVVVGRVWDHRIVFAINTLTERNVNLLSALESSRTRAAVVAAVVIAALRTSVRAILNMVARVVSFRFASPFFQTKVLSATQEARAPPLTLVPAMRATEVRIVSIQFALVSWPTIPLFATKMDPV